MATYQQHPVPFHLEPTVMTTAESGGRASQLVRTPGIHRLARGLWALRDQPLTGVERAVLLQKHLGRPGGGLVVSGVRGLELPRLPVGDTEAWVHGLLAPGSLQRPPRSSAAAAHAFTAAQQRVDLLWREHRVQSQQEGVRIARSHGLPTLEGPWGSRIAHPLESLARLAPPAGPRRRPSLV